MCKGLRLGLAALVAWMLMPKAMAGDPAPQIRCKICVLRVSDACFEKLSHGECCGSEESCCPAAGCTAKCGQARCCETRVATPCGTTGECCEHKCCEKPCGQCCPQQGCCQKAKACGVLPPTVSQCQARKWLELVRGCDCCEVICCPEIVTLNGQLGQVQFNSQQFFTTGLNPTCVGGQRTVVPVSEPFHTGCCICVKPCVVPGQNATLLYLNASFCELDGPAPLTPIMATARACGEESESCPTISYTQFLQQPSMTTRGVCKVIACQDGRTIVFDAGRRTVVRENESAVPVLGDLPVIGEFFRCKTADLVSDHVVVMVTPVPCGEECCETPVASATPDDVPLFAMPVMCGEWQRTAPVPPPTAMTFMYNAAQPPCPPRAVSYVSAPVEFLPIMPRPVPCAAPCAPLPPPVAPGVFVVAPTTPCPTAACPTALARCAANCAAAHAPVVATACVTAATPATACTRCAAPACCASSGDAQLVNLMIEYYEACAARDTAKARNLAARCIALDPTCFAK